MKKNAPQHHPDADAILEKVLQGIAGNRIPGLHFPAYFLGIALPAIEADSIRMTLPCGPHACGGDGQIDLTALCLLADSALATASRRHVADGARLATLRLELQFTGLPMAADVTALGRPLGLFADSAVRQLLAQATMSTAAGVVFHASG
jgi:acyl-coenzyme A thioesterase PaaI-like protein